MQFSSVYHFYFQKTVEPFLNRFLEAVFEKPDSTPLTIKSLFDFFDKMASRYCEGDSDEIAEAWKSNRCEKIYNVIQLQPLCYELMLPTGLHEHNGSYLWW